MEEKWLVFRLKGKELCSYTLKGTFKEEKEETLKLLAYENKCKIEDIEIKIESR